MRESDSRPESGIVTWHTKGFNQRGELVIDFQPHQLRSPKGGANMTYMTEERRMIQEPAREFSMKEVLPVANKLDPMKGDIPMDLRDKMAELGYFGIRIPEEYGGLGLGCFEYCLVTEELARGWMSVAEHHRPRQRLFGTEAFSEEQRAHATCRAWRRASSSAPSRCPSPTPAPTSPTSPAARRTATATNGY